jgi:thioredoxin-dependent peroxiredoxin
VKRSIGEQAPLFEARTSSVEKVKLLDALDQGPVALIFLRFEGCPLTRMRLAQLQQELPMYREKNLRLLVVLESPAEAVTGYVKRKKLDLEIIDDPDRELFDAYGVDPGGLIEFLAPPVITATVKATIKGHFHGACNGNEFQLPAAFVIRQDGRLQLAYYGKHIAQTASTETILAALKD